MASTTASTAYPRRRRVPTKRTSACRCWCVVPVLLVATKPTSWFSTPTTCPHSRTLHAPHRGRVTPRTTVMLRTGAPLGPSSRGALGPGGALYCSKLTTHRREEPPLLILASSPAARST